MLAYGRQSIGQDDIDEVVRVLKSDYLTTGPEVPKFEEAFCDYTGAAHAVAASNGTATLHIISLAIGLTAQDQVIVPSISFVATANGPHYCGAEVIFSDVDPETGLMTPGTLREAMKRADPARLKAVFVVHLNGSPVDLQEIAAITKDAGLYLIEDACHALGTTYPIGNDTGKIGDCALSDFSSFSFHPVKTITSGEGGMITCRDPAMAAKLALLRNHGLERDPDLFTDAHIGFEEGTGAPNPWAYELQMLGYNYRMTDFQAALGRSQLGKMAERFGPQRKKLVAAYRRKLAPISHLVTPAPNTDNENAVLHLMVGRIDFAARGKTRREVMMQLRDLGVGTQVHYIPIHRQPYYAKLNPDLVLDGAEAYYAGCLSLPLYPDMTEADVDTVVQALAKVLGQ